MDEHKHSFNLASDAYIRRLPDEAQREVQEARGRSDERLQALVEDHAEHKDERIAAAFKSLTQHYEAAFKLPPPIGFPPHRIKQASEIEIEARIAVNNAYLASKEEISSAQTRLEHGLIEKHLGIDLPKPPDLDRR